MTQKGPKRIAGYAPIRDYAAIGDGRTVALVARDGSIDWLCLPAPRLPERFRRSGGRRARRPLPPRAGGPLRASRRYVADTNVLGRQPGRRSTRDGRDDAPRTRPNAVSRARTARGPRRHGPLRWRFEPRFGYGGAERGSNDVLAYLLRRAALTPLLSGTWDAGEPVRAGGHRPLRDQRRRKEPARPPPLIRNLVIPTREDADGRWMRRHGSGAIGLGREYSGGWASGDPRRARATKLLVHAPSGSIAAAATTSLPEKIGGERNWDYRFSWPRDAAFTLQALLALGCAPEARAYFSWILHATQLTHPRLQVLYRLDGRADAAERSLPLSGYRDSRPVRVGNGAAGDSSTSTASCSRPPRASLPPTAGSIVTTAGVSPRSPTSSASAGRSRTPGSGRCGASRHISSSRR